jgi:hypothetical protein
MEQNNDEPLTLDSALAREILTHIHILLSGIRDISLTMTKEQSSAIQRKNAERIFVFTQETHWKFQDLTLLKPTLGEFFPSPPDQTTTVLNETLDDDERRGLQNTELGRQLLQDCPDLLHLTLCYRELHDVILVFGRLLTLLSLLQEHGSSITFTSSTKVGEKYNSIRIKLVCENENLLSIKDNLLFPIPVPYQSPGKWHCHYISGLEFAIARSMLKRIGGDFMVEKEDGHLMLTLEIPSLKEGKPDLLSSLFPKDFPPDIETNG